MYFLIPLLLSSPAEAFSETDYHQLLLTNVCQGCDLTGAPLDNLDLSNADLTGSDLRYASMQNTNFTMAEMEYTWLRGAQADMAIFVLAQLSNSYVSGADFTRANFTQANMQRLYSLDSTVFQEAIFDRANVTESILPLSDFFMANALGGTFVDVDFSRSNFEDADFSYTTLDYATLDDVRIITTDFRESSIKRVRFYRSDFVSAELEGVDFHGAWLDDMDLSGYNLRRVNFNATYLSGTNLTYADMTQAVFAEQDLTDFDLEHAILDEANLDQVRMTNTNLLWTSVRNTWLADIIDLKNAGVVGTDFTGSVCPDCDLDEVRWMTVILDDAFFEGSSFRMAEIINGHAYGAHFANANFEEAEFNASDWSGVDLTCASMKGSEMVRADFIDASFRGVDCRECGLAGYIHGADLSYADFSNGHMGYTPGTLKAHGTVAHYANFRGFDFDGGGVQFWDSDFRHSDFKNTNWSGDFSSHQASFSGATGFSPNPSEPSSYIGYCATLMPDGTVYTSWPAAPWEWWLIDCPADAEPIDPTPISSPPHCDNDAQPAQPPSRGR